jgi:hypothetical protein
VREAIHADQASGQPPEPRTNVRQRTEKTILGAYHSHCHSRSLESRTDEVFVLAERAARRLAAILTLSLLVLTKEI